MDETPVLDALRVGTPIRARSLLVIAHPDDETISMGGCLPLFHDLGLIQITDGSPRCRSYAHCTGHVTWQSYAATREDEAIRALGRLGVAPARRVCFGAPDQGAIHQFGRLIEVLDRELRNIDLIFTHPYEGGHPDHDTAACAVQIACDRIARAGRPPPLRLEFTSYHWRDGKRRAGEFWPHPERPDVSVHLSGKVRARKREALDCYESQSAVLAWFDPDIERYRLAPQYDFLRTPPPGTCLYDSFGWTLTGAEWRRAAAVALARFGLEPAGCGSPS
jgi:LmbE family N-acetylglucosaminyl deacetylase